MGHVDFFGIAPVLFILNCYKVHLFYKEFNSLHRGVKITNIFNMKVDHICVGTWEIGASSLISCVIISITIANKRWLKADPWCSPIFTSNPSVTPTAQLTAGILSSHKYLVLFSYTSLPIQTLSCSTTPLILAPCQTLSLSPQTHNVAPSDRLCTSPSTLSKQTVHL